jgi:hypothetical protein
MSEGLAAAVTDVKDVHHLVLDGEQNPVYMRFASVEQLAHLKGKALILGSKRTSLREVGK